ncbi:MAG: FAD-dependent oxidoreductase [Saprospiraceae bacterium]
MKIAIIGNGIAGITAARFIRKLSDHEITIISSESDHFFSRTALMYVYMGHMRWEDIKPYEDWFWSKNNLNLVNDHVQAINSKEKTLSLRSGSSISFDKLIIASGSKSNKFGWPGQDLEGVQGLYSKQDLESMEAASKDLKRAVIVGGGLIGIEMAEMFLTRNIPVTFLVREKSYWSNVLPKEESEMVNRTIMHHGIDLRLESELAEILDYGNGKVGAVLTKTGEKISCGFVGLTAGVHPNIDFIKGSGIETDRGILVNENLATTQKDIYAIGDCAQIQNPRPGRKPVEAIWYTGRMMGETVAYNICGQNKSYDPGIWFNSAKFFNIEYQVYGQVNAKPEPHEKSIYWEHPDGKKSIRLVYDDYSKKILGFNLMGVRYRHEVCEKWIKEETNIEKVLEQLPIANFDPEFYKSYEQNLIKQYEKASGKTIRTKAKRGLSAALSFLK